MALRFLGIWPNTPDDGSPTIWLEDTTGDLIIQSWKADEATIREAQQVGSVPGHSTEIPTPETVIRLSANMLQFVRGRKARAMTVATAVREALAKAQRSAMRLEMRDSCLHDAPEPSVGSKGTGTISPIGIRGGDRGWAWWPR